MKKLWLVMLTSLSFSSLYSSKLYIENNDDSRFFSFSNPVKETKSKSTANKKKVKSKATTSRFADYVPGRSMGEGELAE